ncbi:MAG: hypothetical protein IJX90_07540 [Blautia sp.]|nr:hypothetical protein [Blautia sp.]
MKVKTRQKNVIKRSVVSERSMTVIHKIPVEITVEINGSRLKNNMTVTGYVERRPPLTTKTGNRRRCTLCGTRPLKAHEREALRVFSSVRQSPRRRPCILSYDFSQQSILLLYRKDPRFQIILDSGKYVFFNGYLCLKSGICHSKMTGRYFLSSGVMKNPGKYLLGKELRVSSASLKGHSASRERIIGYREPPDHLTNDAFDTFLGDHGENSSFGKQLTEYMKNTTCEELSERTGVSVDTILKYRQYRNQPNQPRPVLKNVVALCIGLHLVYYCSEHLLGLAGYTLRDTPDEKAYQFLLQCAPAETVSRCNRFLLSRGLKPLTPLQ